MHITHELFICHLFICFIFLSVLDYCNLVNSHLKSSHWPDALKSMILIFTITIRSHRDWKTQSKKETSVWFSALYFVWCLFFIVITKRKKIYNNNHKKESFEGKNLGILRLANKRSQHSTSTYLRREMKGTKNENKENKRIWQKEKNKSKKLAPMKLNTISNWGDQKVKLFSTIYFKKIKPRGGFLLFSFLFVKKNKMHDLGSDGWEGRKGEEMEAGGGEVGRDNKKYCTYNTFFHSSLSFI